MRYHGSILAKGATMAIQIGDIEYIRYRNGLLRAKCRSKDSVAVTWASGFSQGMTAETWDTREFLENPESARAVTGCEYAAAEEFFNALGAGNTAPSVASAGRTGRPGI